MGEEDLECDDPTERPIARTVHGAHAPSTTLRYELVVAEGVPDLGQEIAS